MPKLATLFLAAAAMAALMPACGPRKVWQPCMDTSCTLCGGTGTYKCDKCSGTGQLGRCNACVQTPGKVRCDVCQNGVIQHGIACAPHFGENCFKCAGTGWKIEPGARCTYCGGSTWKACGTCGGDGSVGCNKCGQSGEVKHGRWEFEPAK